MVRSIKFRKGEPQMPKSKLNRNPLILDEKAQKLGYDSYEDYLLYDVYWWIFRLRNIRTVCWCCRDTGASKMRLHHIHYERMGEELPTDVVTVCGGCHRKIHKMVNDRNAKLAYAHIVLRQQFKDVVLQSSFDFGELEAAEAAYEASPEPEPTFDDLWDRLYEEADEATYTH
jgi:5-methylcytosine-specific restriction endonuclease McrA